MPHKTKPEACTVLYVLKGDPNSRRAEELLGELNVPIDIVRHDTPQHGKWDMEVYPTAVHQGELYKGLENIKNLVEQVRFDTKKLRS